MKVKVKKILEQAMLSTRQEKKWWKTYQASDVSVQLDIVEVVAGGIHFPWVQLSGVLHVEDCLELTHENNSTM